jgi:GntR family transcriptional regulator/MocR family aminotransferase
VEFTNGRSEKELIERAAAERVRVYPLSEYSIECSIEDSSKNTTVILGYATLTEQEIVEAVERLKRAWM